ncbi:MAG: type II CAAX endopeptidase family protein [Candidatus Acidiferrales bacterium]|jgi:membrane protease YdiL (CAAX protease family)
MTEDRDNPLPPETPEPLEPVLQSVEPAPPADIVPPEVRLPAGQLSAATKRPLPDDFRVPWDWLDVVLLTVLAVVGTWVTAILVVRALGVFGVTQAHLRKSPGMLSVVSVVAQIVLDLGLLAYLAAQMRVRFHSSFWRTIGWRPLETGGIRRGIACAGLVFGGFALAAGVALAEPLFPPKHPLPLQTMLQDPRAALLFMLTAVLVAPVVEETIFRGYLYPVVARSWGMGAGIMITGAVFGLLHAGQLWGGWWQIALLVVVGILFTLARAVTRTVVASYILHASYNALPVVADLLSSSGTRRIPHIH